MGIFKGRRESAKNNDLDMSDFDFDADVFSDDFEFSTGNGKADNRSPILKHTVSVGKGIGSGLLKRSTVEKVLKNLTPRVYGDLYSNVSDGLDRASFVAQDVKDNLNQVKKQTQTLLRGVSNTLEEKGASRVAAVLKKFAGKPSSSSYGGHRDTIDDTVNATLEALFTVQNESKKEDRKEKLLKDAVDKTRFDNQFRVLGSIDYTLRKGLLFQESNTINYYRKSIELDVRKLHLMNQMFAHTKEANSLMMRALNDIKVNTGLPDYVKLHSSEAFKELTRRRLMNNVQQRLFKGPGEFLSSLADTVGDILKERIGTFRDFMDMATDVGDQASMMSEHVSGTDASNMVGGMIGGSLAARAGRRYRSAFRNTRMGKWLERNAERVGRFNSDPGQATQDFLRSGRVQNFLSRGGKRQLSGVEEAVLGFFDDVVSTANNRKLKINIGEDSNQYGYYSGMGGGELSGKVTNVVIPGYLSRILRELTIIRTGNKNTPLMEYDYTSGRFVTQTKNRDALIKSLGEHQSSSLYRDTGEDAIRNAGLFGFGSLTSKYKGGLKSQDVQYIGKVLTNAAIQQVIVDYDFLSNPNNFPDLSKEKHKAFVDGLNKVREDDKKYDLDNMSNFNRIAQNALSRVTVDNDKIKGMLNAGYGHHLMKAGILYSRNGQIFLNNQKLVDAITNRPEVLLDPDGESETLSMNVNRSKPYHYIGRNTPFNNQQSGVDNNDTSPTNTLIEAIRDIQVQMLKTNEEQLQALMTISQMQMNHYTTIYNDKGAGSWFRGMQQYMREKTQRTRERLSSLTALPRSWVRKIWGGSSYFFREMFNPMAMLRMQRDLMKGAVGKVGSVLSGAKNLLNKGLGNVVLPDIYLPGKDSPIIKALDFSSNNLFNEDGSVITSPKDIKGDILDAAGNLLVSASELKNAVYKTPISRAFSPLSNLLKGGMKTLSGLAFKGAKSYFKLATLPFTIATKAFNVSASLYRRLTDIYIYRTNEKGDKVLTLGLKVEQIFNGSLFTEAGKPIRSIKDLDSSLEILDANGNVVISSEEVADGFYNRQGVRLDGLFNRLALSWRLPMQTVKGAVKRVLKAGLSMAGGITRGISGLFRGAYNKVVSFFDGSFRSAWLGNYTMMNETNSILTNILTLLNRRLPGKATPIIGDMDGDGDRDNSVADLRQRERKRKEEQKSWLEKIKSHQILATLIAKAMGKSKKEKEDDENSLWDKIKGLVGGALAGLGGLGGGLGDLFGGRDRGRGRGRGRGRAARGKGGRFSRFGRGVAGSIGKVAGAAGAGARGLGRGALGIAGRGLSFVGAGLAAKGMYDSYQESDWGGLALNTGLAGLSLAGMGMGSTMASAGTFLATNPIGWGILALTAVGAGGYYLWKKWRTGLIEADFPRMMMYGVHPAKQKDEAETLLKLEGIISEALVDNRDVITIDERKVDIAKILELFNIDPEDVESQEDWYVWFENRFKKPFMDSVQAVKNINPKHTLNDLRDLKPEDLSRYYRAIKPGANSYRDMEPSPFQGSSLTTTGKDAVDFIDTKLTTDVRNKPIDNQDKMIMNMGGYTPGYMGTFNPPAKITNKEVAVSLSPASSIIISGMATILKKPSTLDRARFKAYGLISPEQTDLQLTFSSTEQYLLSAIKYQGNRAIFNGDIQQAVEDLSVYYGVSKNDTEGQVRLRDYLVNRFIPVFTVYMTQLKELGINDTTGQVNVDKQMTVFKALKSATNENGQSIWSYTIPISNKFDVLNPNMDSIQFETEEAKRSGNGDSKEGRENRLLSNTEKQASSGGFFQRAKDWVKDFKNASWTGSGGRLSKMWDLAKDTIPVLNVVDTAYNFARDTVSNITGGNKEMALMLYSAFRKSGFSHNQARILVGEIGRENGLRKELIFGYHKDPHSGYNIGMLSWQGERSTRLQQFLQSKGLIRNGKLVESPEALQAQTDFIYQEMQQPYYANKISAFLNNPDIDLFTGANIIGKHYIKWRIDDPKYSAQGIRNRNHYVGVLDAALNAKGGGQAFTGMSNNTARTGHVSNQIVTDPIAHARSMVAAHNLKQSGFGKVNVAAVGGPGGLLLRNQPAANPTDVPMFGRNLRNINAAINGTLPASLALNKNATYKDVARNTSPGSSDTPWMSIAMGEKGVNERDHGSRIREYHKAAGLNAGGSTSWCGSFVQWCLTKSGNSGMALNQTPARAFSWSNYGTAYSGGVIPYGAIIVWDFSHVSFCAGVEGNTILSLGGNQSSQAKGSQRNGGEVTVSRIDIRKVRSIRIPVGYNGQGGTYSDEPSAYTPPPKPVTLRSLAEAQKAAGDSLKNSANVYNDAMKMKFGENWKEKMAKENASTKKVADNSLPANTPLVPKAKDALKSIQHLNKDKVTKAIGKTKKAETAKAVNDDIVPLIAQNDPYMVALRKGKGYALPEVKNPAKNLLLSGNDTIDLLNGNNSASLKDALAKTKLLRQKYKEANEKQFKPESLTKKPDTPLVKQQHSMDVVAQSAMATKQSRDVMEGIYSVNQEILKANREQVNLLKEILREVKSKKVSPITETTSKATGESTGKPTVTSPVDLNKKAS